MNILFITHAPPGVPLDGARLITHYLARELAAGHRLYLVSLHDEAELTHPQMREWFAATELIPLRNRPRFQKWATSLIDTMPLWARAYDVPAVHVTVRKMLVQYSIDMVHCDTGLMAQYVTDMGNTRRIVAPHDSLTRALEQQAQYSPDARIRFAAQFQKNKMRRYEADIYARFNRVVVVSNTERAYLRALSNKLEVCVIPNGVSTEDFAPSAEPETPNTLGFVGVMDVVPNQAAVLYFTREIFPRIRRAIPDATFTIIGRNPTPEIRGLAGAHLRVTGTVDDVRPHIAAQSVIVCPMRAAGGIKNKLLEALAMSKAIVATPEAADGLDVQDGAQLMLADDTQAFAAACVRLLRDGAARAHLGQNARAWALEHTWSKSALAYVQLYREAIDAAAGR